MVKDSGIIYPVSAIFISDTILILQVKIRKIKVTSIFIHFLVSVSVLLFNRRYFEIRVIFAWRNVHTPLDLYL